MSDALMAGISGLKAHQKMIDVAGNNLANMDTTGFKAGRVSFAELFSETIREASQPTAGMGGTNPIQIGGGVMLARVDRIMSQGSMVNTGQPLDMAIEGSGYFVLHDGQKDIYTRVGEFAVDSQYYLVDPGTGFRVQRIGSEGVSEGFQDPASNSIRIPYDVALAAQVTQNIFYTGNLSADLATPSTNLLTSVIQYTKAGAVMGESLSLDELDQTANLGTTDRIMLYGRRSDGVELTTTDQNGTTSGVAIELYNGSRFLTLGDLLDKITQAYQITTNVPALAETWQGPTQTTANGSYFEVDGASGQDASFTLAWNGGQVPSGATVTFDKNTAGLAALGAHGTKETAAFAGTSASDNYWTSTGGAAAEFTLKWDNGSGALQTYTFTAAQIPNLGQGQTVTVTDLVNAINNMAGLSSNVQASNVNGQVVITDLTTGARTNAEFAATQGELTWHADVAGANGVVDGADLNVTDGTSVANGTVSAADIAAALNDAGCALSTFVTASVDAQGRLVLTDKATGVRADATFSGVNLRWAAGTSLSGQTPSASDFSTIQQGRAHSVVAEDTSVASLVNGEIRLEDVVSGYSQADMRLAYEGVGTFDLPKYFQVLQAGGEASKSTSVQVFDSQGVGHTMTATFVKTRTANQWDMVVNGIEGDVELVDRRVNGITFLENGSFGGISGADNSSIQVRFANNPTNTRTLTVRLGTVGMYDGVSQFGGASTIAPSRQDGYASGWLSSLSVTREGVLVGVFTNGIRRDVAALKLANFQNPAGMKDIGGNYFVPSANSGDPIPTKALEGGTGSIHGGSVEKSNVEVATEFVNLIQAQNGYMANSRTIRVANDMLTALTGLIR